MLMFSKARILASFLEGFWKSGDACSDLRINSTKVVRKVFHYSEFCRHLKIVSVSADT